MDDLVAKNQQTQVLLHTLTKRLDDLEKKSGFPHLQQQLDQALKRIKELEEENARLKSEKSVSSESKLTHKYPVTSNHKFTHRVPIKELLHSPQGGLDFIGKTIVVAGWAKTIREQGSGRFVFIELNDGSCFASLQIVLDHQRPGFADINGPRSGVGAAIYAKGTIIKSPGTEQAIEMQAEEAELIGSCIPGDYPLAGKQRMTPEYLRTIAHLRPRTNLISAMERVRNLCAYATHLFFQKNNFFYVHTPVITASDCEGAGEMFQVTALLKAGQAAIKDVPQTKDGRFDYSQDFFGKPAFLTVSGQLNGEMFASAMTKIYTFGPTFRAEDSHTSRHAAEFWMIEPEVSFADLTDNMDLAEAYVKYVTRYVMENDLEDLEFFDKYVEKGLIKRLKNVVDSPFQRLTYTEAVDLLIKSGHKFENPVSWGIDLASEHERYIAEQIYKKPVILTDYPKDIKAFYMKLNPDGKTVRAMDVLVPRIGELIGGSQREENLGLLEKRIEEMKLDKKSYSAYLDLRRFGSVPHSGFGLGFERLIMFVTGIDNIRDVLPFPRTPGHAEF